MRPSALLYFYRRRLRVHAVQELLAGVGVAIAVALVFATIVASASIAGSADEVVHAVVGPADLQLHARSAEGFDERLLARVERLPDVKQAAPLLEQTATIAGPDGRRATVDLAGADTSLVVLDGLAHTLPRATLTAGGIGISRATAKALALPPDATGSGKTTKVSLLLRGRAIPLNVSAVLGPEAFGALSQATVAVMPLESLQALAGLRGRVTRILVQTKPGRLRAVRSELRTVAGGRLQVAPADQDVGLLRQALRPSDQASGFFAAISALLGLLFAFNALLLTVPERRRAIADMRLIGTKRSAIAQMFLFQALCLGVLASLAGLLGGYALSRGVFHQSPHYLAEAFTLGANTVVAAQPLLLAFLAGVLATCLASMVPLLDLRRAQAVDAVYRQEGVPGNTLPASAQRLLALSAALLLALATALFVLEPELALTASALLALATVLTVPLVFSTILRAAHVLAERRQNLTILAVALSSLRSTTLRSLALAATGAVALFGSIALGGSRSDLLHGIEGFSRSYSADAPIWVGSPGDNQAVVDFRPALARRLAQAPGVLTVHSFQGGFLEFGGRRVWIIARPPGAGREVLRSQISEGDLHATVARLGEGGWIAVSRQIAQEHHTGVGGTLVLPTPSGPVPMKIAATTTNLAWSPGAVFLDSADYTRLWGTSAPTALAVVPDPGRSIASVAQAIERAIGPASGLEVTTSRSRERQIDALTGEGLAQLGDISILLLFAAILAMAAALTSAIWQRRASLAGLRLSGVRPQRLRLILLVESALMLGAGCATGALAGIYGQMVIDGYLEHVTGFPVSSLGASLRPLQTFAIVIAVVLAIVIVPGWLASRVPPTLALNE
jgi:putative ABC transport system permease protein